MEGIAQKVILITGASGNLGVATARTLREAGACLALFDRDETVLNATFPDLVDDPDCVLNTCADVTDIKQFRLSFARVIERFGRVDGLVHTVGGYQAGRPLHETPVSSLERMFRLNVQTAFVASKVVIPEMLSRKSGKIILTGARAAFHGRPNMAAYSAAKAAVIRLTESLSEEVRGSGINVNCVVPGTIDTPQNRTAMPEADPEKWVRPESLAAVILFLASSLARDIHGAAIPVYGHS